MSLYVKFIFSDLSSKSLLFLGFTFGVVLILCSPVQRIVMFHNISGHSHIRFKSSSSDSQFDDCLREVLFKGKHRKLCLRIDWPCKLNISSIILMPNCLLYQQGYYYCKSDIIAQVGFNVYDSVVGRDGDVKHFRSMPCRDCLCCFFFGWRLRRPV